METYRSAAPAKGKGIDVDPAGTGGWEGFSTDAGHPSRPEGAVEEAEAEGKRKPGAHEPKTSIGGGSAGSAAGGGSGGDMSTNGTNASALGGAPEPEPSDDLAAPGKDAPRAAAPGIGSTSALPGIDANSSAGAGEGASGAAPAGGEGVPSGSGAAAQPSPQGNEPSSGKGGSEGKKPSMIPGVGSTASGDHGAPSDDVGLGQDGEVTPTGHH